MPSLGSEGTSTLVGFIAAIFVFSLVFAAVMELSLSEHTSAPEAEDVNLTAIANNLANLVLRSPGRSWYAPGACVNGELNPALLQPEAVERFALGEEPCAYTSDEDGNVNNVSYDKIETLFGAKTDADPANQRVDYVEARESLDLVGLGLDFHLRTWPILQTVDDLIQNGKKDPNLRPLYIGDYEREQGGQPATPTVQHAKGWIDGTEAVTLWVNVTNNGTLDTMFSVRFTIPTKTPVVVEEHTPLVPDGEWFNVTFTLNKTSDWEWDDPADKRFDYLVRGVSQTLGEGSVSLSAVDMTRPAPARRVLTAEMDQLVWVKTGPTLAVKVTYDNLKGNGQSNGDYTDWSLELRKKNGDLVATATGLDSKGGTRSFTLAETGDFQVRLQGAAGWTANTEWFSVVAIDPDPFTPAGGSGTWNPQAPVKIEADYLDFLIEKFDNGVFSSEYSSAAVPNITGGDILPDDNQALADELPLRLRNGTGQGTTTLYNTMVIGSNVDHDTLTSGNIKYPIRDWVQAGGSLIVLGSSDQSVQWLQPLFHVAIESAGGGIAVPDDKHPILHTPNDLGYTSYDNHGTVWEFNQADDAEHFTDVVVQGGDPILTVSDPGEFGDGRIILTTWQAFDLVAGEESGCTPGAYTSACHGLAFFDNLVTLSFHTLYIDYGPKIPTDRPVGVESRIVTVYHPELRMAVELFAVIYVFD